MAAYFLDASALVKRYVTEAGTAWVTGLLDPMVRHRLYVARITGAEVVAALTRRERGRHNLLHKSKIRISRNMLAMLRRKTYCRVCMRDINCVGVVEHSARAGVREDWESRVGTATSWKFVTPARHVPSSSPS